MNQLELLADRAHKICVENFWGRDWEGGGCYLHLEVSEFIESLRGKKGTPDEEAADVLFVLLSMLRAADIDISSVLSNLETSISSLEAK